MNDNEEELFQAKPDYKVGHWVLVRFDLKNKKNVHFVGQIVKISDICEPEVVFLRKHSENKHGTTFTWPTSRDETEVPSSDIVTILPEPSLGRRGELTFGVTFDSYFLQ